ncbi:Small ribosomal subunit biogenesis GTPase RsgA [Alphaproteobacteria bacterium SO-S41]|nr:Small ribosomal subunit biogenesis GTPase RsgA [Alphaproteobacteria bacterium SO-S41]
MIELYGWSDALQETFHDYAAEGLKPARVTMQQRGRYRLATDDGDLIAGVAGRLSNTNGDYPVAGDWVAASLRPEEDAATIHAVLPRSSAFVRKASGTGREAQVVAANADFALLTASLNADLSLRRLERYLATARESRATPLIVLTKADLCDDVAARVAEVEAIALGAAVHAVSAMSGLGLEALEAAVGPRRTAVLLGSSGAGKSTLVNALAGEALMATQGIIAEGARGRHTTTHRELVRLPGGALLLDTPGMRELGLWDAEEGVAATFTDIEELALNCRFTNCGHGSEPGCAVRAALEGGTLDAARWESYSKLQRELAHEVRKGDWVARQAQKKVYIGRHKAYRALVKDRDKD